MSKKEDYLDGIETIRAAVCDLNGNFRGKRLPFSQIDKVYNGGIRLPISVIGVDMWGEDIHHNANVFSTGDIDGVCEFTGRGPLPVFWSETPSALMPLWVRDEDGDTHTADPRRVLADVKKRYDDKGLTPVVATELEFYLFEKKDGQPLPPVSPFTNKRMTSDSILSSQELDDFDEFFNDIYKACEAYNIPADTAIAENGPGQYEINLLHVDCPLKAADDAVFFKFIVKGIARKHGLGATFMAKPYGQRSGSGLHVHFSLLDKEGNNVFDDGTESGSKTMLYAVEGLLDTMKDSTLIFAPHFNSYRRLQPSTHAPVSIAWGYENRTTPIRIPGGSHKARRIEHRVAGADANPYLVIASVLGAALRGIEQELFPFQPVEGDSYAENLPRIPVSWRQSLDFFEKSNAMKKVLNEDVCEALIKCKKQEMHVFNNKVTDFEYFTYLDRV